MTLEDLLSRLERVKSNGDSYVARCPAHHDRNPSLQVSERDDGSLGVHCHAGCDPSDVMEALGLSLRDLMGPEPDEIVYVYRDESGTPLYEVVRRPGKEFLQRRYTQQGMEWGLADTRRVLYRLPDVLEADSNRWVFVCEGEKDVDAIWDAGGIATCNSGGAGSWDDSFSEVLAGRNVTIVRDKDDAGAKHASQVMMSLQPFVKTMRLVEARQGKDASDHLRAGYGLDEFVEPSLFRPLDFTKPAAPVKWLLEEYIAEGDLVLLSGVPGLGKSWWTMALAVAVANGTRFLDRGTKHGRVLYFDEENPEDVIRSRVTRLGLQNHSGLRYIAAQGIRLDTHPELLVQEAGIFRPDLVVIDSLARAHSKEENSFAEMSEILNGVLKPLARGSGAGIILIHHHDKAGRGPRGSGDISAAVDCQIDVYGEPGSGRFKEKVHKSRRRLSKESFWIDIANVPGGGVALRASAA